MTKRTLLFAALLALSPTIALAQECPGGFTGTQLSVQSASGSQQSWTGLGDLTYADGVGAQIEMATVPNWQGGNPIVLKTPAGSQNRACLQGPAIENTNAIDLSWSASKRASDMGVTLQGGRLTVEDVRLYNVHDGIGPSRDRPEAVGQGAFIMRRVWMTWVRDDCIENDHFRSGLIEDSLFDGCYSFLSSRNKNRTDEDFRRNEEVTVRDSLIRIAQMPEPARHEGRDYTGSGPIFKYSGNSPSLVLENNIFLIEDVPSDDNEPSRWLSKAGKRLGFRGDWGLLKGCEENIIVWLGSGVYPGNLPDDPNCVTVTTDKSVWDNARAAWIAGHPTVPRLAQDPITVELKADGFTPQVVALDVGAPPNPDPDPDPPPPDAEHYHPDLIRAIEDLTARVDALGSVDLSDIEAAIEAERAARRAAGAALSQ